MDYFYHWYNENCKFTSYKKNNSVEKYLNLVGAFTYNVTKILNSFYYTSFDKEANQIFDFIKKYIISSLIDFEVLDTIEIDKNQKKFLHECISHINKKEKFNNCKYKKENIEFFIRIAYFLFLLVLKTKAFLEINEFLEKLDHKGQYLLDLKFLIHQSIHNQNQIHIPNLYKSRIIDRMISNWQKDARIHLENLPESIHNPFHIQEIYLQYNGLESTYLIKNTDNFTKYITVNDTEEITMLNEQTGRHEKISLTPKKNFFDYITITNRYFKFFTNVFAPYTDFILNGTNLSNTNIIKFLKNCMRYFQISIATEIKLLVISIFGTIADTDYYCEYRKYLSLKKKLETRRFVMNEIDYFFFLSDDNILSNYENIVYSDVQFYFQGDIALENSNVYIKHSNLFYKKFKSISACNNNHENIIKMYKYHCQQRKKNQFEYFRNGFMKAYLQNIPPLIIKKFSEFVKLLLHYGILQQEFKQQTWYLILDFDIFPLKIPYTNQFEFLSKDIQRYYYQILESNKTLIQKKLNSKKKNINIGKYIVSYSPEEGYSLPSLNISSLNLDHFQLKLFEVCRKLTLFDVLNALLPKRKELVEKFLSFIFLNNIYTDVHTFFSLEKKSVPLFLSNPTSRTETRDKIIIKKLKKESENQNKKKIITFLRNYQGWDKK